MKHCCLALTARMDIKSEWSEPDSSFTAHVGQSLNQFSTHDASDNHILPLLGRHLRRHLFRRLIYALVVSTT